MDNKIILEKKKNFSYPILLWTLMTIFCFFEKPICLILTPIILGAVMPLDKKDLNFKKEYNMALNFALTNIVVFISIFIVVFFTNWLLFLTDDILRIPALISLIFAILIFLTVWVGYFVLSIIKLTKTLNDENYQIPFLISFFTEKGGRK